MRFFRNPDGAVHSVPDDFQVPTGADDLPQHGWEEVSEADAPQALLGSTTGVQLDPEVTAVHLHDAALVDDPSTPGNPGVPDVVSSGHVGDDPEATPVPVPEQAAEPVQPVEGAATSPTEPTGEPAPVENPAPDAPETPAETPTVFGEGYTPEATQ